MEVFHTCGRAKGYYQGCTIYNPMVLNRFNQGAYMVSQLMFFHIPTFSSNRLYFPQLNMCKMGICHGRFVTSFSDRSPLRNIIWKHLVPRCHTGNSLSIWDEAIHNTPQPNPRHQPFILPWTRYFTNVMQDISLLRSLVHQ